MSKKVLILTAIVLVFLACQIQAAVIDSNWVGGSSGEWGKASNWNPRIVPDNNATNTFVVTIDAGSDRFDIGLQQSRTIDQLDCYGNVWLESQTPYDIVFTLVDTNGLTNYGNLRIRGGPYNEVAEFTIQGNVKNVSGSILQLFGVTIESDFYNSSGAFTDVKYENIFPGGVLNAGTISIGGASEMSVDANLISDGQIRVLGGLCAATGFLTNDVNGVIQGFGFVFADQLRNKGKIYAYGGSLAIHGGGSITNTGILANKAVSSLHIKPAVDVNNLGTIEVNAGGGVAFDCNLVNKPNGIIKLLGGTLAATSITQTAGATFEGFGGITGDVMINSNGLIELTGPTNIVGDVTISPGATLEISDGQTLITGHTTNNGEIRVVNGKVVFQGGYSGSGIVKKE